MTSSTATPAPRPPLPARQPSPAIYGFIRGFERFVASPYTCPAGKLTVGYGHVIAESQRSQFARISVDTAEAMLKDDVALHALHLRAITRCALTQGQFDALCSFSFNCGMKAYEDSTLRRLLEAGDAAGAAAQFQRWNKARDPKTNELVPLAGLTKRRAAEARIFSGDAAGYQVKP